MTTKPVTCAVFNDRLMAYLEGETDAAERSSLERHAAGCGSCGSLVADVQRLRARAAGLPELAPSRDLWGGIAARIEAPVVPLRNGAARPSVSRRLTIRASLVAASVLGAAALGYLAGARTELSRPPLASATPGGMEPAVPVVASDAMPVAGAPAQPAVQARGVAPAAGMPATTRPGSPAAAAAPYNVRLAGAGFNADYDREIARLRLLLDERRQQLDPATVAVVERNLLIIDAAIAESRQAIAQDPASPFLIESLNRSLMAKVELMRFAAMLPSRT